MVPSGLLFIPVGSYGGMSEVLKDKENQDESSGTFGDEEFIAQREGNEVVAEVEDDDEMGKDGKKEDVTPLCWDIVEEPSGRKIHR
ncbi:hypothetical protein Dimus_031586, partial [Dionaea muscipula]